MSRRPPLNRPRILRSRRGRDITLAATWSAALIGWNNLAGRQAWHQRWYPLANLGATGTALAAAAASGLTADDLGLRRERLGAGLCWAALPSGALAAGWVIVAAVPASRGALADQRITSLTWPQVAYQAAVRIPAGTVLWEEVAFRGVLQASLRRVLPGPAALAITCTVFGIWHVRPTVEALRINELTASRRSLAWSVVASVAGTRGRPAAVLAAGTVRQPGRAGPAASVRQLRRGAGRSRRTRNNCPCRIRCTFK